MSEVTTLKQLMLDAARYRWLRDNFDELDIESIWMMGREERKVETKHIESTFNNS